MTHVSARMFTRLITIIAMVMQLGVVAYHHHETLGGHGEVHAHEVRAALGVTDYAGHGHHHDHDEHGDTHHGPDENDDHECDSCVLKSTVSNQLIPEGAATLFAPVHTGKHQHAAQNEKPRLKIVLRYHARAPPSQVAIL